MRKLKNAQYIPTPWKIAKEGDDVFADGDITICTHDGQRSICDIIGTTVLDELNAAFVVHACNAYEELVVALKAAEEQLNVLSSAGDKTESTTRALSVIKSALSKVEGR